MSVTSRHNTTTFILSLFFSYDFIFISTTIERQHQLKWTFYVFKNSVTQSAARACDTSENLTDIEPKKRIWKDDFGD